jgi:outer membrane lipoprotein SlyB
MPGHGAIRKAHMKLLFAGVAFLLLSACASHRPILYPNDHLKTVGEERSRLDIQECERQAAEYVKSNAGADTAKSTAIGAAAGAVVGGAVGAVTGDFGTGVAAGAAGGGATGLLSGLFRSSKPSPTHMNFVDRCLREKGYDVIGWD